MKIVGIYLAAGNSKRFGKDKVKQQVGKTSLGAIALRTALQANLQEIIVVTKETDSLDWLPKEIKSRIIHTKCHSKGISDSIKCGVNLAETIDADAVLIMLADQPLISLAMLQLIISSYKQAEKDVSFVISTHDGLPKPPILFNKYMFKEILHLSGDIGAREIVRNKRWLEKSISLDYSNWELFFDVDTQEDYNILLENI